MTNTRSHKARSRTGNTQESEAWAGAARSGGTDVAAALVAILEALGVRYAFGVCGGAIARVWEALLDSPIETLHFRHEAGAVFAAIEASVALRAPVVVYCTTGPGLSNTITGLIAARAEGAQVIVVSPRSSAAQRGRIAAQETSHYATPSADLFQRGWLFDEAVVLESASELRQLRVRLARGLDRPGSFVAHVNIPVSLQSTPTKAAPAPAPSRARVAKPTTDVAVLDEVLRRMARERFALLVGSGARRASGPIRMLGEATGAPVLATARGKGVVPERSRQYLGVTGMGGHPSAIDALAVYAPQFMIVLGTTMGEPSSGWDERLVPPGGFVHVDHDPRVFGLAFPDAPVLGVEADVAEFVSALLARGHELAYRPYTGASLGTPERPRRLRSGGPIRQQLLMAAIQEVIVDGTDMPVVVEPGSAMGWAPHYLRFDEPGRFRTVGVFGSMGQMTAGVIGLALARKGPALCITGDGSMLMNNETNAAVAYGNVPAKWVVLNDGRYGMVEKGMERNGRDGTPAHFPQCDFASITRGMRAKGIRVTCEADVAAALREAVATEGPVVVDVLVDPRQTAPFGSRMRALEMQRGES